MNTNNNTIVHISPDFVICNKIARDDIQVKVSYSFGVWLVVFFFIELAQSKIAFELYFQ